MSLQTIARRYATALADVIQTRGESREVQEELTGWQQMLNANPTLSEVFANPTIALDKKRAVLNRLIEMSRPRPTTANFLNVLLQNQRLTNLDEINRKLAAVLDERAGVVAAIVSSARPVPVEAQRQLESRLASLTGSKVRIEFATDTNLIGGLVTRIGSTVYDGSVRTHLQQIKTKMAG